jgi:hypothetical protein
MNPPKEIVRGALIEQRWNAIDGRRWRGPCMVMFSSALAIALPGQPRKAPETSGETPLRPQGGQAIRRSWRFDPFAVPNCSKPACQHAWISRDKRQILRPRHQSHRSTSPAECHHRTETDTDRHRQDTRVAGSTTTQNKMDMRSCVRRKRIMQCSSLKMHVPAK